MGTNSPDNKLTLNSGSSTYTYMTFYNDGTGSTLWSDGLLIGTDDDGDCYFWNYEDESIAFATNGTHRMRIENVYALDLCMATRP